MCIRDSGQTGPKVQRPAHDLAMQADSGVVSLNRAPDGTPAMPHMPVADMAGSLMALSAILMALLRRERTGEGDCIDLSMQDALMAWLPNVLGPPFAQGRDPVVQNERSWGGNAMYRLYRCSDVRWLALGGAEHKFADNLLGALGRPDLAALCRLPPGAGQAAVKERCIRDRHDAPRCTYTKAIAMKELPLKGLRILAVEQYGAGPYGSMHLADLGAEVIKIESPPGGDVSRSTGPYFLGTGDSLFFQTFNLNKRSLRLDLKAADGRAAFEELVAGADAVLNNLRGDQPAKLGLDYATLGKLNPKIVCAHLSAYGRDNTRTAWPGYDYLMQAEAGFMALTGEPDAPPARFGLSLIHI